MWPPTVPEERFYNEKWLLIDRMLFLAINNKMSRRMLPPTIYEERFYYETWLFIDRLLLLAINNKRSSKDEFHYLNQG